MKPPEGWTAPPVPKAAGRVTKLQVIVSSCRRPRALEACLASLRQSDIELYVVDGYEGMDTSAIIEQYADDFRLLSGNPGADVLRNVGLRNFANQPLVFITSEDYVYPAGWAEEVLSNCYRLEDAHRAGGRRWGMLACPTQQTIIEHSNYSVAACSRYQSDLFSDMEVLRTDVESGSGILIDREVLRRIGGFPVYGLHGAGAIALNVEMARRGCATGYFKTPVVRHLLSGAAGYEPAHEVVLWKDRARTHSPGNRNGYTWPADLEGTALWGV